MSNLLDEKISKQVRQIFEQVEQPVEVLFFGQSSDCDYCDETRQLVSEVTGLSDKLSLSIHDLQSDAALAAQYNVDKAPSLVLLGKEADGTRTDYGVRYAGIPSGHEFTSLIYGLINVSKRNSGLSEKTRAALQAITEPVNLMVFVTPTCPYCPQAVMLAHQMAMENPLIQAEMVEAMEFQELSERYNVGGVPQTTINFGAGTVVGAVPEEHLLNEMLRAVRHPAN